MVNRLTSAQALVQLAAAPRDGLPSLELFRHGSLVVEVYKPDTIDQQTPHTRDEVYVVIAGSGQFVNGSARDPFQPGDVLFVAAGVAHRFEDFTPDFATWVFFHGPEGGEAAGV